VILELFQDKNNKWRIRLKGRNGKIIMSSEAYSSQHKALPSAGAVKTADIQIRLKPVRREQ
jgi:uncharacterized protein YegP (UPF0339 family)